MFKFKTRVAPLAQLAVHSIRPPPIGAFLRIFLNRFLFSTVFPGACVRARVCARKTMARGFPIRVCLAQNITLVLAFSL
jgi:hypothetical protein